MMQILNKKEAFSFAVEKLAADPEVTYIEAVTIQMQKSGIEPDQVGGLITERILEKMREEAIALNLLKRKKSRKTAKK